jgi:hypothetical protein
MSEASAYGNTALSLFPSSLSPSCPDRLLFIVCYATIWTWGKNKLVSTFVYPSHVAATLVDGRWSNQYYSRVECPAGWAQFRLRRKPVHKSLVTAACVLIFAGELGPFDH